MANVRDFKYVTEIARYGSISKAAEALFLSQPTLSKFLQRVEKEVEMPLFRRVGKQLVLTEAGEIYVSRSKSILELEHQMRQDLQDLASMRRGNIRIGITPGRSVFMSRQVIPAFRKLYPHIRLIVYPRSNMVLLKMMQNNELDFAVTNYAESVANFHTQVIGEDELVLVAASDSPLAEKAVEVPGARFPTLAVEDWQNEKFVLPVSTSYSRRIIVQCWEELGVSPEIVMETPDLRMVMDAVRSGVGVSMFISVPCGRKSGLRYFSLRGCDLPKQMTSILSHQNGCYSEAQQTLMQIIQDAYHYEDQKT